MYLLMTKVRAAICIFIWNIPKIIGEKMFDKLDYDKMSILSKIALAILEVIIFLFFFIGLIIFVIILIFALPVILFFIFIFALTLNEKQREIFWNRIFEEKKW